MSDSGRQMGDCKHDRTPASCTDCLRERMAELEADNQPLKAAAFVPDNPRADAPGRCKCGASAADPYGYCGC